MISAKKRSCSERKERGQAFDVWRRFRKNKLALSGFMILLALILVAIFAPVLAPEGYDAQVIADSLKSPFTDGHLLGTDYVGRDLVSRLIWGARYTLQCGVVAVVVSAIAGSILGIIAGFYGGKVDNIIMRCMDVLLAIPGVLLAISIAAALGSGMRNAIIAVGISGIPQFARVVRSSVLSVRGMEYIEAAHAIDASDLRIITTNVLPNVLSSILVQTTISVANAIMQTASLSFLGLGVQSPIPEWGAMISGSRAYLRDYGYMVTVPGLAIILLVFSINVIGDGLRDALDPRLK